MGCGRLFEGTAEQMFANMQKLATLDDATRVYCAHEYTLSNARWAVTAEPDNSALAERRMAEVDCAARGGDTDRTDQHRPRKGDKPLSCARATPPTWRTPRAAKDAFR